MDIGAWWAIVHGVAKSWTRQSAHTHTSPSTHTRSWEFSGGSLRFLCTFKSSVSIVCEHFWLIGGLVQKDLKKCQWLETSFQHQPFSTASAVCTITHLLPFLWMRTSDSQLLLIWTPRKRKRPELWMSCRILFFSPELKQKSPVCVGYPAIHTAAGFELWDTSHCFNAAYLVVLCPETMLTPGEI